MRDLFLKILLLLILPLLKVGSLGGASLADSESKDSTLQRLKARYYFMQGSLEASQMNLAEAYDYFKKAYELDPTFSDAAFNYGSQRIFLRTDTAQTPEEQFRSLEMMRGYVDENPLDLYATQVYGYLSTALDTVEESVRVYETTYALMPSETLLLPALSDAYMRLMKSKEAIGSLERYEKIEGKSTELSLKKITILMASKDTLGAIEEVERLVNDNPRDPYRMILKGNLYEVVGDMDSVLQAYKEAERLSPQNGAVKMSLAQYYRNQGDSVMLDNMMYEALLSEELELNDKLGILGDYLQKLLDEEGDHTRGDHLFSVLSEQYPHEPDVLEMSARYSGAKKDYEAGAETIGYAIDMDPANEKYWLMLLSFDLAEKKYNDAVVNYDKAKEYFTPSMQMKNLYSAAASMLDDTVKAREILEGLIADKDPRLLNPETRDQARRSLDYEGLVWVSALYCMLGDLYYKNNEADKGFEEYEVSLYFLPDNALTLNNFAYFLSEEGKDLEKAKKMSRRSLELNENNATYLDTYAWILYKLGEYREAMEYMQLAMDLAIEQGDENEEYVAHYEAIKEALEKETKEEEDK